jgi:hypothetical protein
LGAGFEGEAIINRGIKKKGISMESKTEPKGPREIDPKKKKIIVIAIVCIVIICMTFTFLKWVDLEFVKTDSQGSTLVITLRNNGFATASGSSIIIRLNEKDEFKWNNSDISGWTEKTGYIEINGHPGGNIIWDIEVLYEGLIHDKR